MKRTNHLIASFILLICLFGLAGCSQGISTKGMNSNAEQKTAAQTSSSNQNNGAQAETPQDAQTQDEKKETKHSSDDAQKTSVSDEKPSAKKTTHKKKSSSSNKTNTTSSTTIPSEPSVESSKIKVTITVDCITAVNQGYKEALALTSSGTLAHKKITLNKGASIYDALKASGLSIGAESTAMGTYVYAISSLREKDCGSKSGWLYSVNGTFISKSCDSARLKNGDTVRWRYTCDGGKDL